MASGARRPAPAGGWRHWPSAPGACAQGARGVVCRRPLQLGAAQRAAAALKLALGELPVGCLTNVAYYRGPNTHECANAWSCVHLPTGQSSLAMAPLLHLGAPPPRCQSGLQPEPAGRSRHRPSRLRHHPAAAERSRSLETGVQTPPPRGSQTRTCPAPALRQDTAPRWQGGCPPARWCGCGSRTWPIGGAASLPLCCRCHPEVLLMTCPATRQPPGAGRHGRERQQTRLPLQSFPCRQR